ncbi:MAG: TRAP transporter substrate-binding protein DctP [Deltaproteobacteria bacterium]|nr:TRAP transporter substrate-binding protein DctP [Deltaproteobacteria bacterium]
MKALIASICVYIIVLSAAPAHSLVIKLGTVAPEGSPWHDAILETAQKWKELSGGRVTVRVYPGAVAGDENDMLRKIRIGQLHATALTSSTLIEIVPDIEAISLPMLVRTDGELDYVIEKFGPEFEARLAKKGFKVLNWSSTGWVYFFTKEPVTTPEDMKKRSLYRSAEEVGIQSCPAGDHRPATSASNRPCGRVSFTAGRSGVVPDVYVGTAHDRPSLAAASGNNGHLNASVEQDPG